MRSAFRHLAAREPGGQLLHPGNVAKGGKRAYRSRLEKDRSSRLSRHSITSAGHASPPGAALRQTLHQRLRFGDLRHRSRQREAFESRGEDGPGVSATACRLAKPRERERRAEHKCGGGLLACDGNSGLQGRFGGGCILGVGFQKNFATESMNFRVETAVPAALNFSQRLIEGGERGVHLAQLSLSSAKRV